MAVKEVKTFWRTEERKGSDISYWLLGPKFYRYEDPWKTLVEAKNTCQRIHDIFDGDVDVLILLAETSIVGEAYLNAVMWTNNGLIYDTFPLSIPDANTYFYELRKVVKRLERDGFKFEEEDAYLITALFEEES